MSQQIITVPHNTEVYESNNKFYLKTFLLDSSTAANGMGVHPEFVPKNIHKFVGRPVILTSNFNHPHEFEHYKETKDYKIDVQELLKLQEPYKIGTIVDISTNSSIQQGGNANYSALLEITDPKAISAFRAGKIPQYVSPSIYRIHETDPVHSITDYEPLHIAIVDNPAYGFHKANIRQTCQGNKNECQRMLAQASEPGLGYCVEKTLNSLKNTLPINSSQVNSNVLSSSVTMVDENTNNSVQETKVEQETTVAPQQVVEQKPEESQEKTPINTPITGSPSLQQEPVEQENEAKEKSETSELPAKLDTEAEAPCEKAAREFEERIALYDKKLKELEKFRASYEKQAAETKLQTKKNKIEQAVPTNYADSEEERTKLVESLMNVGDEQLDTILNGIAIPARNVRQASNNRKPKVTDFVKDTGNTKNVNQASFSNKLDTLEMLSKFTGVDIVPKRRNEGGIM